MRNQLRGLTRRTYNLRAKVDCLSMLMCQVNETKRLVSFRTLPIHAWKIGRLFSQEVILFSHPPSRRVCNIHPNMCIMGFRRPKIARYI